MSGNEAKGKKRSKSFYRKSAHGGKRAREGSNILEPGVRGFLVMCNSNENLAVKECYNILNEYADKLYGQEKDKEQLPALKSKSSDEDGEFEDIEKAMNKEISDLKNITPAQKRFQNVKTKAKNCVFIRSTVEDPIKLCVAIMEDISQHGLKKARFAARILPIIGTCKAHTNDIEKLGKDVLVSIFSKDCACTPSTYTIIFKVRNNNTDTCSKTSVIPALTKVVSDINPSIQFSWSDFEVAVLVEVVCTICCLGVAPGYSKFRKYNLQELVQGPKTCAITINPKVDSSNKTESAIAIKTSELNSTLEATNTSIISELDSNFFPANALHRMCDPEIGILETTNNTTMMLTDSESSKSSTHIAAEISPGKDQVIIETPPLCDVTSSS